MNDSDTLIKREYQNTLRILNNKKDSAKCCLQETHFKYKDTEFQRMQISRQGTISRIKKGIIE